MKTILSIIAGVFLGLTITSVYQFSTVIEGETDCMLQYIRSGERSGYIYRFNDGTGHIEPRSKDKESLKPYKIGTANRCVIQMGNVYNDLKNTHYCYTTYILLKLK